jgi:ATP-dependent DNA helicase RecQ
MDVGLRAERVLRDVFGYASFRGDQRDIVTHVADGKDTVVLMPTGGGKSLRRSSARAWESWCLP